MAAEPSKGEGETTATAPVSPPLASDPTSALRQMGYDVQGLTNTECRHRINLLDTNVRIMRGERNRFVCVCVSVCVCVNHTLQFIFVDLFLCTFFHVDQHTKNRLQHQVKQAQDKVKDNKEKIKVNKQLPYLVANVVEVCSVW